MKIIKRGEITYYIKQEAIIVGIKGNQFIAYTVYNLQNRNPFYSFKRDILHSQEGEYDNPIRLISLASKHKLIAVASHKPTEEEIKNSL